MTSSPGSTIARSVDGDRGEAAVGHLDVGRVVVQAGPRQQRAGDGGRDFGSLNL